MAGPAQPLTDRVPNTAKYDDAIARAKARAAASAPTPPLRDTPSFDAAARMAPPTPTMAAPPKQVSEATAEGLSRLAEAQAAFRPEPVRENPEAVEEVELTEDQRLRASVEKRLKPLDVGQHLMGVGEVLQRVPIIPDKLEPTFRTVTEYEEGWVDAWIRKQGEISGRQYNRLMAEVSLAFSVHSLNGQAWPVTIDRSGKVIDDAVEDRLGRIRKLSATVINMMAMNMGWFIERVNKALTSEALGNG